VRLSGTDNTGDLAVNTTSCSSCHGLNGDGNATDLRLSNSSNSSDLAVNSTSSNDNSDSSDCLASQNSTSTQNSTSSSDACAKGKKDQAKDKNAASGKKGGMMKKKMGKTSLNSSFTVNSTSFAGAKNNGTSTAASPMQDAKKHVKDAQNAVAQMMAGNNSVTMDQVNGNISLALDAMNNLTVSMG
jgi:hypothetical protein